MDKISHEIIFPRNNPFAGMFLVDGDGGECGEPGEDNTVTLGHRSDQILLSLSEIACPLVLQK